MNTAAPSSPWVDRTAELLEAVRARAPLVQCITNTVVQNVTANVLLAVGASPAMVDVRTEAGPFARVADALLVNTGTPHAEQVEAALEAADAAVDAGAPWVLDPVAVGALPVRTALAGGLLARRPTVLRGNASEVLALLSDTAGGRGTDATASADDARTVATAAAGRHVGAVAVSGPVDLLVTPGGAVVRVANGTELLTRITGGGCALGAVVAAFAAVVPDDPGAAAVAATVVHTVAAELAAQEAGGPGTFQPLFLDRLAALVPEDVVRTARVHVESAADPVAVTA
ncbi:hydroxyethylthiazole kinase [Curtobacterium sp. 'Ferrero']|uniref:hydroxyethylthiazole kinase n=1 Tax=Curtobacterium sp. 'Ferrero' TaxID=2033654 RepID=UPI000BDD9FDF|nr:hydroxyethylthiazole kinase [Curtobacterium sp. 'Ferrero']PCN48087.1 hydroxyethylthiazole kinase [Curtobacterium sp. 'Ferrero']